MPFFLPNLNRFRLNSPNPLKFALISSSLPTHLLQITHQSHSISSSNLQKPILSLFEKCNSIKHLKQIQSQMIVSGSILNTSSASRLIALCSNPHVNVLHYCRLVLFHVENPNTFMFNVVIRGFLDSGNPKDSILLYKQMLIMGLRPDHYTFPLLFKSCARIFEIRTGSTLIGNVFKLGIDSDLFVSNGLIHMLAACGDLDTARKEFDRSPVRDVVSWNSLINGYAHVGRPVEALEVFWEMEREEVEIDEVTMIGVVSSCAQLRDLELGREFHRSLEKCGSKCKLNIPLTNALMDMYVKCGELPAARALFEKMSERTVVSWTTMVVGLVRCGLLDDARMYFDRMPDKDLVVWNAMIAGYVQYNRGKEALALFYHMQERRVKPNEAVMASVLNVCSQLGALDLGQWAHRYIDKHNIPLTVALGTALVDMYAKCGNIEKSLQVFREIPERNALTWTAMIGGLAIQGHGRDAIDHFSEMVSIGLKPDEVTFVQLLSACCHAGLVSEGRRFLAQMSSKFNLLPNVKHFSCVVDLLGRAGLLDEAEELILTMPVEPDPVIWGALFFACRIHGNVAMGSRVATRLLELDPHDSGIYVLLSNMYMEANMWREAGKVRRMMREQGVEKTPGCSSIEIDGIVYEFVARDKSHPQLEEISSCLLQLTRQIELV